MRILHLNHYGSHVGGIEGYIGEVASALQAAGHSSHLVFSSSDDFGRLIPDTTYAPLPEWPCPPTKAVEVVEQISAKFQPDVAYVHAVHHPALVGWVARHLPTVAYVHSPHIVCPGYAQYLRRRMCVCKSKADLLCISSAQIERCCFGRNPLRHVRRLGEVRSFIRTYQRFAVLVGSTFMRQLLQRNRISLDQIGLLPPVLIGSNDREMLPSSNPGHMLFVGRLTPEKGLRQLIEAVALVEGDWELMVAGEGQEKGECQKLARQLNVAEKIHFLGWLSQPEMEELYQRCAFVVVPSLWPEPFGRVGPEAFQHGRPVVAFAVGGVTDWLEDDVSGYLVPPGDVTQLRQRIQMMLDSPSKQAEMGDNARLQAKERWNANLHVDLLVRHFERACNCTKTGRNPST